MSRTSWIIVGVVGVGALALLAYFLMQRSSASAMLPESLGGGNDNAGIVSRVGTALTDLTSTIVGAASNDEPSGEDALP